MNSTDHIDPSLIDQFPDEHDGYPEELAAEDSHDTLVEAAAQASREFPQHLWVEPRDWAKVAAENDRHKTWALNYLDRFTNQSPTHECTCHALRACMESTRNRQRSISLGPPVAGQRLSASATSASVWLSPLSVYAEANPRQRGGASTRGVMEIARRRGMLPETIQPRDYGFRHAIVGTAGKGGVNQASGSWVPLSRFPAGWEDTAKHFRPLEIIVPDSYEQIVCLLLGGPEGRGYAVGAGRNGHAIPYAIANIAQGLLGYVDSYDVVRWDSFRTVRSAVGSAYCIASVTTPDDWDHPAI
jgi:hypothetical protein